MGLLACDIGFCCTPVHVDNTDFDECLSLCICVCVCVCVWNTIYKDESTCNLLVCCGDIRSSFELKPERLRQ